MANPLSLVKKIGVDLFFYFAKGARIDAALIWQGRNRIPMYEFPRPDAKPIEISGNHIVYDAFDMLRHWKIEVYGNLLLKNNSKIHAYNITLVNADEVFDTCSKIQALTSIAPNEQIEVKISYVQFMNCHGGQETEILPDIPENKKSKILRIRYQNEGGTKLLTKFYPSFKTTYNEYSYANSSE